MVLPSEAFQLCSLICVFTSFSQPSHSLLGHGNPESPKSTFVPKVFHHRIIPSFVVIQPLAAPGAIVQSQGAILSLAFCIMKPRSDLQLAIVLGSCSVPAIGTISLIHAYISIQEVIAFLCPFATYHVLSVGVTRRSYSSLFSSPFTLYLFTTTLPCA